jgi:hypothetical protein
MPEPITLSLIWLGQTAGAAIIGRLAERGVDRLLDGPRQFVLPPVAEPRRHRLGDVTSDLDITVRYGGLDRRPVLLAFQTAPREGERTAGVTVPMVLGETAHLTLPRDDYLISALVLDPPEDLGGKPVLHGIGWARHWMASTGTDRLTIATEKPTETLLKKLGLRAADGTGPFDLAPPGATAPRQLPAAPGNGFPPPSAAYSLVERAAQRNAALVHPPADDSKCRAAVSRFGPRCTLPVGLRGRNGLCPAHANAVRIGQTVYEWETREQIR